ncbi:tellurite resistance/C4-dicarboxylate transporter family protein [Streptomyces sp. NPDC008150]|uniref:tellurite resistance/C4-dicarboxylate transporter family protein n=1 Tax=Streptomyces sp. NPDC008150 TaxID=3364816 RepID=UPI0036E2312E
MPSSPPARRRDSRSLLLRAWWARRPPAAGAAVMATGIVSVGLHLTGYETLSRISLVLAAAAWVALAADFVARLLRERERWMEEARSPAALTAVAATCVLGTRLSLLGRQTLAEALLATAALLWPLLMTLVSRHRRRRMPGAVFLVCVATQGLAVLAATLAGALAVDWMARAAMVLFWLGLLFYVLALLSFDVRQVLTGAGDHWVAGGALAISALAGARLLLAQGPELYLWNSDNADALRRVTVVLLVLDLSVYVVLAVAEVLRPRLSYDVRRWSTVFPMGMTAVATLAVGTELDQAWLRVLGQVLLWIAVAAWLVVGAGAVRAAWTASRPGRVAPPASG